MVAESHSRHDYLKGALAGALATLFHTAVMLALHPRLPRARHRLPPTQITSAIARRAGVKAAQRGTVLTAATIISHFGYGAAAGALYPPLARAGGQGRILAGVGFGVGVWAASYLGWIPALRILAPATQQPAQRNAAMILAHVAWGAALAAIYGRVSEHDAKRR